LLAQTTVTDEVEVASVTQAPLPGAAVSLASSPITVTITATDTAGNSATTSFQLTVVAADPSATSLYAKNGPVPGAGLDGRIQAGAKWLGFGLPAINDNAQVAYIGRWKAAAITGTSPVPAQSGAGIFIDDTLVVKVGEAVPGIPGSNFKTLKDPVIG